jgi:Ca-activated chloride channel family protein
MAPRSKAGTLALALIAVAFLAAPASARAQVAGPVSPGNAPVGHSQPSARPIQVDVEMVLVNVSVTDFQDRPITDLGKADFRIFENDVEQEILTFSHEDAPISIGLLFDMSNSMSNKVDKVRSAAMQILTTANPQDEFFLVSFGNRAELTSGFTSNLEELQARMMSVKPRGRTALFDALVLGMAEMKHARNRNRAFVVISDGGDNHSRTRESVVRSDLKEADAQVYALGIFDELDMKRSREEREGPALLSDFAELTGGRVFPVTNTSELPDVAAKIGTELRDRYVLGYKPGGPHDGAWRTIKVRLAAPETLPPLRVFAKTGYYAPKNLP